MSTVNHNLGQPVLADWIVDYIEDMKVPPPQTQEEADMLNRQISKIQSKVQKLVTEWNLRKSLSEVTKLNKNRSNLKEWIFSLKRRLYPSYLVSIVTGSCENETSIPIIEDSEPGEKLIYWYFIKRLVSEWILDDTTDPDALTLQQKDMLVFRVIEDLRKKDDSKARMEALNSALFNVPTMESTDVEEYYGNILDFYNWADSQYPNAAGIVRELLPQLRVCLDRFGETNSLGRLKDVIGDILHRDDGSKHGPEVINDWYYSLNNFVEDRRIFKSSKALVSVRTTESTSQKRVPFKKVRDLMHERYDSASGGFVFSAEEVSELLVGKCFKCLGTWSRRHRCPPKSKSKNCPT